MSAPDGKAIGRGDRASTQGVSTEERG
jgi:hypothetical protein